MNLNAHVKATVEAMVCDVHGKNPKVLVLEKQVDIVSCCTDFKIICLRKMTSILIEHKDQELNIVANKKK